MLEFRLKVEVIDIRGSQKCLREAENFDDNEEMEDRKGGEDIYLSTCRIRVAYRTALRSKFLNACSRDDV
jgi:hypothetical protein